MYAKLHGAVLVGIDATTIEIEVDIGNGLPRFEIVGLPDTAVNESRDRVRAAIKNAGFRFPDQRITVNLAPGHRRKNGCSFDLPIALGILLASGQVESRVDLSRTLVCGELGLRGAVRRFDGVLPVTILAYREGRDLVLPRGAANEASLIPEVRSLSVATLEQACRWLRAEPHDECSPDPPLEPEDDASNPPELSAEAVPDFASIVGQVAARRALEIAAAGGHNLLMIGPPGSGKTLLARAFSGILPPLSREESLEVSKIYSVAGLLRSGRLISARPVRSPHSTISDVALVGGSKFVRPGEVTLAHRGILFLDELSEFRRIALDLLRGPLSDGRITISRATGTITFPASFQLLAATNPCPCGYLGDGAKECLCDPYVVRQYRSHLSGPILDRIDIHIEVPRLAKDWLGRLRHARGEPSKAVRARVLAARSVQAGRFAGTGLSSNAEIGPDQIHDLCALCDRAEASLTQATDRFGFSLRANYKIRKLARTIADLAGVKEILPTHVMEAIAYRSFDRGEMQAAA